MLKGWRCVLYLLYLRPAIAITSPRVLRFRCPVVMFLLAKLILENLMNQTNLEELEDEMRPEILPSELREA